MVSLKSVDALEKFLNARQPGSRTDQHLTRIVIGDEIPEALQKDCEMDLGLVRECVEAKGWELEVFPDFEGTPPSFAIIRIGHTTVTAYLKPVSDEDWGTLNLDAAHEVAIKGPFVRLLHRIKTFFVGD